LVKRFPKIILADDLLVHGLNIARLIENLEGLIVDYLKRKSKQNVSKRAVHCDLLNAVSIYVFALNTSAPLLLDQKLAVSSAVHLSPDRIKPLYQTISRALQKCGIPNTSYVFSTELPWPFCKQEYSSGNESDWSELFQYRENTLRFYYRNSDNKIFETIRFYSPRINQTPNRIAICLVVFGSIPYNQTDPNSPFNALCRDVAKEISQIISHSRIADILNCEHCYLVKPKAQMLAYLLSVLGLSSFYREKISAELKFIYKALFQSNYQRVAANFDRPKRLHPELMQLFNHVSQNDRMCCQFFKVVKEYVDEIDKDMSLVKFLSNSQVGKWKLGNRHNSHLNSSQLYEKAEDIFYEVGMNAECDINHYAMMGKEFGLSKPSKDSIRLERYLQILNRYEVDMVSSIGCALGLMDNGLLTMNLELDQSQEAVRYVMKAEPLSPLRPPPTLFRLTSRLVHGGTRMPQKRF